MAELVKRGSRRSPAAPKLPKVAEVKKDLRAAGNKKAVPGIQRFFQTGPGQYGEGDRFLAISVPTLRKLARKHEALPLRGCVELLKSRYHEARLLALLIMVRAFERGDDEVRRAIYRAYLDNTDRVNNWDLVDSSAAQIVGRHLAKRDRTALNRLAKSKLLWERRIAIVATHHFIRQGEFADTFRIADALLSDREDLIHKAVGWMLREVGKRDQPAEETFLRTRYRRMPRTMLRYAIERFPEPRRLQYLLGEI